jgi:BCD family chlorophyll transporter-like MFS transporter
MKTTPLGWFGIVRLGLVQTALGAVVVLMTSIINRVMVVELALPSFIPGALIAVHYAVQVLRPRWGYGSDIGGRRTVWIIGGMGVLATGGLLAAVATALTAIHPWLGLGLALIAVLMVGLGVGAAGTSLLVLLAGLVAPERRAAAATITWVMMIAGIAVTAGLAGHYLDPFSYVRLIEITASVAGLALVMSILAVWKIEPVRATRVVSVETQPIRFREVLLQIWSETQSRRFTIFVFMSMLAYSAQELLLEPYAGIVFQFSPGESTKLSSSLHGGVLAGMLLVAVLASRAAGHWLGSMRLWTCAGCAASALMLVMIALGGVYGLPWPLRLSVFALGLANGTFAVSAIWSMMGLAGTGAAAHAGTRMGLWGGAQALAFACGGLFGTIAVDISRHLIGPPALAYGVVFLLQAALFAASGLLAFRLTASASSGRAPRSDTAFVVTSSPG